MRKLTKDEAIEITMIQCAHCDDDMHRAYVIATGSTLFLFCQTCEDELKEGEAPSLPQPQGAEHGQEKASS